MTYKNIEASRNIRLWITDVVLPIGTLLTTTLIALPDTRRAMVKGLRTIGNKTKRIFRKGSKRLVITVDAENQEEALYALESMRRELIVIKDHNARIKLRGHVISKKA